MWYQLVEHLIIFDMIPQTQGEMRFRSSIILNIPQYYFHMAAILKNGYHFFSAEYRQGSPPRSCAGRSPEHIDTQHVFTAAHVRWTPKTGFCSLGIKTFR